MRERKALRLSCLTRVRALLVDSGYFAGKDLANPTARSIHV